MRTTIVLPLKLKRLAEARARLMGISLSELVRNSLAKILESRSPLSDPLNDNWETYKGRVSGDVSLNHDEYLYGGR